MTTMTTHAPRTFTLEVDATSSGRTARASGRLIVGAGAEHPAWTGAARLTGSLSIDLRDVTAIDAAGVGRLLTLRQQLAERGGRLAITAASQRVRHVLSLTRLGAVFEAAPSTPPAPTSPVRAPSPPMLCCA